MLQVMICPATFELREVCPLEISEEFHLMIVVDAEKM
jgi:hypothetical protein